MSDIPQPHVHAKTLGWVLVFAVVYADIGTSIFYVPGILYLSIGNLATLAQIITTAVFISIALKYVEICTRCPDGGGVVSICRQAFSAWPYLPLMGGAFITVDYFLTSAISGVAGLYYIATLLPGAKAWVLTASAGLFFMLTVLNIIGLKESAMVIAWLAGAKILVAATLLGTSAWYLTAGGHWGSLIDHISYPGVTLSAETLLIGYATTWLAYSGLESASQISGAMKSPVRGTALRAMILVILVISILSPLVTAFSLYIVPDEVKRADPESLLSALAFIVGGPALGIATVLAAASLLFMACNTAIVGNYHVNLRLADLGFLPAHLRDRNRKFGTPHVSIIISALVPLLILFCTQGHVSTLGDLYAFGLLGTLTVSSISVDKLRWQDGRRDVAFWWGVFTTLCLLVAWAINIFHKPAALAFGGIITVIMVGSGIVMRRRADKRADETFAAAEEAAANLPESETILTLEEAIEASAIESATLMLSIRYVNANLLDEACIHVKGEGKKNCYLIYVDELPGLFLPAEVRPSEDALRILHAGCRYFESHGITAIPIWRLAENAGQAVAEAARELKVKSVCVGASKRNFLWRLVRGRVLKQLADHLPEDCRLIIVG
jgi:amino acid transporter